MRPSRAQTFMEIAKVMARRSTCFRLNVGAVVTRDNRIVSVGYNGSPPGEPHCRGNECEGRYRCTITIHAEKNALAYIPSGLTGPMDLYTTDSPCPDCLVAIMDDGRISRLFFGTPYRLVQHLKPSFYGHRIKVYRVTPSGYIIDWATGDLVDAET